MDPAIKAEWVKALRSGNYDQCNGYLRLGNSFCCLGVLCDIGARKAWDKHGNYTTPNGELRSACLPSFIGDYVGLSSDDALALSTMNDRGWTFDAIANHIEENL